MPDLKQVTEKLYILLRRPVPKLFMEVEFLYFECQMIHIVLTGSSVMFYMEESLIF